MARKTSWVLCSALAIMWFAAGCRGREKEATEAAIDAAETALSTVQTEAARYVPEQLQAAQAALESARKAFAEENYQAALAAAKDAGNKARELAATAAGKKEEWIRAWSSLNGSVPKSMSEVKRRLDAYAHGARRPSGMDQEALEAARAQYEQLRQTWDEASTAAAQGNLGEAIKKTTGMQDALVKLKEMVGIKP